MGKATAKRVSIWTGNWEFFVAVKPSFADDPAWDQALDWVMLMRDRPLDAAMEHEIIAWLGASPRHTAAFQQALIVWQATGLLTPSLCVAAGLPRPAGHGSSAAP